MPTQGHSRVIQIGNRVIAFPDRMSDAQVSAAVRRLAQRVDPKVVLRLVNGGARLADDAQRVMDTMPADQRQAFRDAVQSAINDKAAGNQIKARKILYALGATAQNIFGDTYAQVRRDFDLASRAAVRKTDKSNV
jgi:hypothetical protein